jgi:hypothetical protein
MRWSPSDDRALVALVRAHGPRWSQLAHHLPGRSLSAMRNRWLRMGSSAPGKVRCRTCGAVRRGHTCPAAEDAAGLDDDECLALALAPEFAPEFLAWLEAP